MNFFDPTSPKYINLCSPSTSPSIKDQAISPSYVDMIKKRPPELSLSSKEIFFEKTTIKQGRKSNK